ncbi:MAG: hypothetical protein SW833_20790 [Cyanobacteriota bacterium]|nr:hypothetical protein [Cyanobacteriota bacterium]
MRIWLVSFCALFGVFEFYQWLRALSLPLPVYVVCGLVLAVASNFQRGTVQPKTSQISTPQNQDFVNQPRPIKAGTQSPVSLAPPAISYKLEPPAWKTVGEKT